MKNILLRVGYSPDKAQFNLFYRIMKISVFLLCFCTMCAMATTATSQRAKVSIRKQNVALIKVLDEIESQTNYLFVYSKAVNVGQKVSVNANQMPVENLLHQILNSQGVSYKIEGNYIILTKGRIPESNPSQQSVTPQKKHQRGVVVDNQGNPVIGASVVELGSTNGVLTDSNGEFDLPISQGKNIKISYIGYVAQVLKVAPDRRVTVKLQESTENLSEVVVVGYGTQKKLDLTGSVSSISSKELSERPITTVSNAIAGLAPGVTITQGQGRPGQEGATIRVRGTGTLNSASPYILIDGMEAGTMNEIDPNDIESISILKDAASAAIYGSKAANGVILITTKRGKAGRPVLSYNGSIGWQSETGHVERMNSADAATYYNQALTSNGKAARFTDDEIQKFRDGSDPYNYPNTDWYNLAFRTAFMQQHNVNVSGGNDVVKFMTSAGFLDQAGVLRNDSRRQFNLRSNIDINLSKRFAIRTNMAYINNYYKDADNSYVGGGSDQILRQLNRIAPWITYKYEDGTYGTIGDGNPIAWLDTGEAIKRKNQNFSGVLAVDYKILDGLKFTAQGSYTSNIQDYKAFVKDIQYNASKYHGPNSLDERTYLWSRASFDGLLNYAKVFGKHDIKAMFGYRVEDYNSKQLTATRTGFPNNLLTDMDAGTESTQTNGGYSRELTMMSYFGRLNYEYANRYLFEANFRADASSRFAPGHRWGYFPSFSAGWRISEENFMKNTRDWLTNLKIRASWGQLGNQDALDDYYPSMLTYTIGKNYPFDGTLITGITQTSYKLSTISWEKSTTWGLGFDMTLFQGLTLNFDFYNRKTTGIIMSVPVPGTFGLSAYKDNVGAMRNRGVEVSLGYQKRWKDWTVNAVGNFALNRNKILDLGGVTEQISDYHINRVGCAYESFYAYEADGLFQSQDEADQFTTTYGNPFGKKFKAGDIRYKDVNGDGKLNSGDRKVFNAEQPKFTFGFNLSLSWKNIDFSMLLQGACGVSRYFNEEVFGDFTGDTSHPSTAWFDAWTEDNPGASMPRVFESNTSASYPTNRSSFWIFNTSYLRCKNLQIGYNLPANWLSKLGISRAKVFYSAENLFKIDNLPVNIDPEAPSGRGSHYPQLMTNSLGINLTF
jgi:TonB-linked SusC/RagA family outer membrane protein